MIRFLSLLCCLSVIAGDQHSHRRTEGELYITSNYTFEAPVELLFDLKGADRRLDEVRRLNGDVLDGDVDDEDVDDMEEGSDAEALPVVEKLAFGTGALNTIRKQILRKITKDTKCMLGVEAISGEIDYQEIGEPQHFDPSIVTQRDRELQFGTPGFHNWLRLVANIQGQCNGFCGNDNSDGRRLETDDKRLEMERELRALQEDPEALEESCSKLAKKIIKSIGRKYPLLPNVERFGIKFFNPHLSLEKPIIVWWPSPPDAE